MTAEAEVVVLDANTMPAEPLSFADGRPVEFPPAEPPPRASWWRRLGAWLLGMLFRHLGSGERPRRGILPR